jgi:hypothetical protein
METNQEYILWVFPTNESSEFNLNAPVLKQNIVEILVDLSRYVCSTQAKNL